MVVVGMGRLGYQCCTFFSFWGVTCDLNWLIDVFVGSKLLYHWFCQVIVCGGAITISEGEICMLRFWFLELIRAFQLQYFGAWCVHCPRGVCNESGSPGLVYGFLRVLVQNRHAGACRFAWFGHFWREVLIEVSKVSLGACFCQQLATSMIRNFC